MAFRESLKWSLRSNAVQDGSEACEALVNGLSFSELEAVREALCYELPRFEQRKRLAATGVLNALPYPVYRFITNTLKRRRREKNSCIGAVEAGASHPFESLLRSLYGNTLQIIEGGTVVVCLTHDIDTADCLDYLPVVLKQEANEGIFSCINVLTDGPYRFDRERFREAEEEGFEIGLHGDSHDMAIGFRPEMRIRTRIQRAREAIGLDVKGYRAPALGVSSRLLAILDELGFQYDSSVKSNIYYPEGTGPGAPYLYPDTGLWELPLSLQDDSIFRDQLLSEDEGVILVEKVIQRALDSGRRLLVFNTHPIVLKSVPGFYPRFLNLLRSHPRLSICLPGQLVRELAAKKKKMRADGR